MRDQLRCERVSYRLSLSHHVSRWTQATVSTIHAIIKFFNSFKCPLSWHQWFDEGYQADHKIFYNLQTETEKKRLCETRFTVQKWRKKTPPTRQSLTQDFMSLASGSRNRNFKLVADTQCTYDYGSSICPRKISNTTLHSDADIDISRPGLKSRVFSYIFSKLDVEENIRVLVWISRKQLIAKLSLGFHVTIDRPIWSGKLFPLFKSYQFFNSNWSSLLGSSHIDD